MISLLSTTDERCDHAKDAGAIATSRKWTLFEFFRFFKRFRHTAKKLFNVHTQKECPVVIMPLTEAEHPIAYTVDEPLPLNVDSILNVPSGSLLCRLSEVFSSTGLMKATPSNSPALPSEAAFPVLQFASPSATTEITVYDVRQFQPVILQTHHEVNSSTGTVDDSEAKVLGAPEPTAEAAQPLSMDTVRPSAGPLSAVVEDKQNAQVASTSNVAKRGIITLRSKLFLDGPLDEKTAALGIAQLLRNIYQMHLSGMIHRNINPDSIRIDDEGNFILCGFEYSVTFPRKPVPDRESFPLYPDCTRNPYLVGRPVRYKGNGYIPSQAFIRGKASFNADYSALGYVYHEIRHGQDALPVEQSVGRRTVFHLMKSVLSENEYDFIRRLVMSSGRGRFDSVEEMMQHPVFDGIDWGRLH